MAINVNIIPKIIHQTWKNSALPYHFEILSNTWKVLHPDWSYNLWTDDMNRSFIKEFYPYFLAKYDSYPKHIQRVDAVRYFILLKYGGVYIDLDFQCFKNISPLLKNEICVFGKEPELHCKKFFKDMILCNAFMAVSPDNDFIKKICKIIYQLPISNNITPIGVLESTGPFMLTGTYKNYKKKKSIRILDSSYLYPLTMDEVKTMYNHSPADDNLQNKLNKAYALHYFWGGW